MIKEIKEDSKEYQLEAVKEDSNNIQFIENPSEEVQLIVVRYWYYETYKKSNRQS